jgi:hypothetical protein
MFRSQLSDHPQASSFVLVLLLLFQPACFVYLVCGCMLSVCMCVQCTCQCDVWSWTVTTVTVHDHVYVCPVYLPMWCLVVNCHNCDSSRPDIIGRYIRHTYTQTTYSHIPDRQSKQAERVVTALAQRMTPEDGQIIATETCRVFN